ncbi:hypothetical protein [Hyphomicrobium sp.]|uniref:hypothetical protein n=1 Tax=Hyphomicrobium sp. TaxID=82 RepID=UPI0035672B84
MLRRRTAGVLPFERGEQHSVFVVFLMMIVVLLLAAGAAVDYARVANMREGIETAVRSASEAGMKAMREGARSDAEIRAIAVSHFDKDVTFARQVGTVDTPYVGIDRAASSVVVEARGTVEMTVSRLCGINEIAVPAASTTSWAPQSADAQ